MKTVQSPSPRASSGVFPLLRRAGLALAPLALWASGAPLGAQPPVAVTSRHAPTLNGRVEGSVQVLLPESFALNGSAALQGDLLVPGTPRVVVNGHPVFAGTLDGSGSAQPASHTVTINGGASLGSLRRRTDPATLPAVPVPPAPAGTRSVSVNSSGQSVGDWSTLRDLTLNSNVGAVAVPAGTYRNFIANGGTSLVLGTAGAAQPSVYNFEQITLNGASTLQVAGPVVVNVANRLLVHGGSAGAPAHPEFLALDVARYEVTLNGGAALYGSVRVPAGTVTVNGGLLVGGVAADRVVLNGNGTIRGASAPPADTTPPVLTLTRPAGNVLVNTVTIEVAGSATDSGAITVTVNGAAAPLAAGLFSLTVSLVEGTNPIEVVATDAAGNRSTATLLVTRDTLPPQVSLETPAAGSVSATASIQVFGTALDASPFEVVVDGTTASPEDDAFLLDLTFPDGEHTLHLAATDAAGNRTEIARSFAVDAAPPVLSGLTPASGSFVAAREVEVRGQVTDLTPVEVRVNGEAAAVGADGSFAVSGVPIAEGANSVEVTATDRAGQATSVILALTGRDLTPPAPATLFPLPERTRERFLTVEGRAEPGAVVSLTGGVEPVVAVAAAGSGLFALPIELRTGENDLVVAVADVAGNAATPLAARVVSDPQAPLPPAGLPSFLHLATGDAQRALAASELPRPLIAVVKDRTGAPLAGVAVTYQVLAGGGRFVEGNATWTGTTDADGYVRARLEAGEPGPQLVRADFPGNLFAPVVFGAEALAPVPGQGTSASGVVRDVNLRALPNVLVRLGGQQTRTGPDGRFRFDEVPAGPHQILELIGRDQVPYPGRWPNISYDLDVVAGIENHLGRPLFLPKVNDGVALPLDAAGVVTADTSVQIAVEGGEPPVRITALAGTRVTFPPDATDKRLSVTRIPASRIPMALEDGRATNLYISVQPAGALFDPPLALSFPNLDRRPAGSEVLVMSFDHDAGRYVRVGTARVSADGRTVESLPGNGIRVGAWHATPPDPPGRQVTAVGELQVYGGSGAAAPLRAGAAARRGRRGAKPAPVAPKVGLGLSLQGKHIDEVTGSVYGVSAVILTPRSAWHYTSEILGRSTFTVPEGEEPLVRFLLEAQTSDPTMTLSEVSFSGGYNLKGNDGTDFAAPQWKAGAAAGASDQTLPIAFRAGSTAKVAAKLQLSKEVVCDPSGSVPWTISFTSAVTSYRGTGEASNLKLPATSLKCDPATKTDALLAASAMQPELADDTVNFANPLALTWKSKLATDQPEAGAGASANPFYVTIAKPAAPFHTLVHTATASLQGKKEKAEIFDAIWAKFKPRRLSRVQPDGTDGSVLTYWGTFSTPSGPTTPGQRENPEFFSTAGLIKNSDGRCGAWKRFLNDAVKVQGITEGKLHTIVPKALDAYKKSDGWFHAILVGPGAFQTTEGSCSVSSIGSPLAGQGNPQPGRENFSNHALLVYNTRLYDPSYGLDHANLKGWEDKSLHSAFYRKPPVGGGQGGTCHVVPNVATTEETVISEDNSTP